MKTLIFLAALFGAQAQAAVTLPYTFSAGSSINASQVNANDQALRDGINAHLVATNPHGVGLATVLAQSNSCGSTNIDFNGTNALNFEVENLSADPACGVSSRGRLIWNTTDSLFKICNGSSFVSIAGTGVNTLASVLTAGNSAGASNLDLNGNQLISARVENGTSDPAASAGRLIYRTDSSTLKVSNGTTWTAVGGAQGLSSVLGVSNSAGSTDLNFNGNQAVNMRLENLASNPGTTTAGRAYYNTSSNKPFFYDGSSWVQMGNTNSLAQTLAIGNSAGSTNLDLNFNQLVKARLENLASSPGTGNAGNIWFNTASKDLGYTTGTASKVVCSLDDIQTLTNKSISGSANTITNVPDTALSANVGLLDATQSFTGAKTFSLPPTMASIRTSSGAVHTITNGLANDTFTLNNATQVLSGKTLNGASMSANLDFNLNQAINLVTEKLSANPVTPTTGRMFYKTTTGEMLYGTGTEWRVLTSNASVTNTLAAVLSNGNSAGAFDIDFNENQALNMRLENLGADPAPNAANAGRVFWNTAQAVAKFDTGSTIKTFIDTASPQTISGKNIDADNNTITNIDDNEIKAGAAIARSKLAALTPNRAVVTNGSGFDTVSATTDTQVGYLSTTTSDVQTQINSKITAGAAAIVNADVSATAAIARSKLASGTINHVLINDGSGVMSSEAQLAPSRGGSGVNNAGTLTWGSNNLAFTTSGATGVTLPTAGTLATLAGSETLTNKTLSGNIATNLVSGAATVTLPTTTSTLATLGLAETLSGAKTFSVPLVLTEVATPAAAPASSVKVYAKSDDKLYRMDSGGTEREIGGGALLLSGTRASPNNITAAGGITATTNQRQLMFVQGNAAPIVVTASPAISAGTIVGQELILVGRSDTNTLTINTGTGVELNGSAVLAASDMLTLIWDGTSWVEQSRSF